MGLEADTVASLAPDPAALAAGRKLAAPGPWTGLGRDAAAVWGVCRGSADYEVRADLSDLATKCTCPSRKFPCKHGLGLLLLAATQPAALPMATAPAWVVEWLAKRAETAARRESRASAPEKPPDAAAQAKRAERRADRVLAGLDALDLWMDDLVRAGLATLDPGDAGAWRKLWNDRAARLVDSQAPALARRLRAVADLPAGADWPARTLAEMGRAALLAHAWRRSADLDPALREDVAQRIGFPPDLDAAAESGERVADRWAVVGQCVDDEDRVRTQRNWLLGETSGRTVLLLQFAPGAQPFPEAVAAGTSFRAEAAFVPGAAGQRIVLRGPREATAPWGGPLRGHETFAAFLDEVAAALARSPWTEAFPCAVRGVVSSDPEVRLVVDRTGAGLPCRVGDPWRFLAVTGGRPADVTGEWDGSTLRVLGVLAGGRFHDLARGAG